MPDALVEQLAGLGALVEPARRDLFLYVAAQSDAVSREQAATAVGLPLHTVKFHLDRLVDEGLLDVEFRRLSGRTGPGAGRPSKLYRRSARQLSVSLPERRYDLAGDVLASAVERSIGTDVPVAEAVREVARQKGLGLAMKSETGSRARTRRRSKRGRAGAVRHDLERTAVVLADHGFEPRVAERELCLANCPFDRLAAEHTELVCGLNLALIEGVVEGLGSDAVSAELAPQEGFCCVKVRG
ncbi:MAG TPA: helix-turn-helix domain-containing protein [Nocardioidaceae bacterium]|nr:helix-turn-helix domain-containing protein [Nocardioidaceae bacterium]